MEDLNVIIAGSAGEGVQTVGAVFSETVLAQGYAVFSWQEYESRIRGGQNSYTVRISEKYPNSPRMDADILLALNDGAARKYRSRLKPDGVLIAPSERWEKMISIDFVQTASKELGKKIYANTIAVGALAGTLDIDLDSLYRILLPRFERKGEEVVAANRSAAEIGFALAREKCREMCPWRLPRRDSRFILINGNEALCLGAARAGCRFVAGYPMTPSTEIMTFLAKEEDRLNILVEQAEDEIGAINMAIGASFAGTRAMTATSGGGFALMVEAVSLAGMTEIPIVIILGQRPGPATGLPTRTAQADLLFAIHAGHGEFPKFVLAPADPRDAFHRTVDAFNLADKYQTPVIVLTDQFLAESAFSIPEFDVESTKPEFHLADPERFEFYKRYQFSDDGISPRLYPGQSRHLVGADSDEHDEEGHITEDLIKTALPMHDKRLRKLEGMRREIPLPERYGIDDAKIVFIGWGSSRNAILEAIEQLKGSGIKAGLIHFTAVWPLPDYSFPEGKIYWAVEGNSTGPFVRLLACEYGLRVTESINRYDGLPLTADFIRSRFHERY